MPPLSKTSTRITHPMRFEEKRLESFQEWKYNINPEKLAKAGFYYTFMQDTVQCPFCSVCIGDWVVNDDPMCEHNKFRNICPFISNEDCGNVPIDENNKITGKTASQSSTCQGTFKTDSVKIEPLNSSQSALIEKPFIKNTKSSEQEKNKIPASEIAFPHYKRIHRRLESFEKWPPALKQKPEQLAEAGLYYNGNGDETICFYCAGGLKHWEETDIPWIEHARNFPECPYVKLCAPEEVFEMNESSPINETSSNTITQETNAKKRNKKEDTTLECVICCSNERNICFHPCGHVLACAECGVSLDTCPMCRKKIEQYSKIFLA